MARIQQNQPGAGRYVSAHSAAGRAVYARMIRYISYGCRRRRWRNESVVQSHITTILLAAVFDRPENGIQVVEMLPNEFKVDIPARLVTGNTPARCDRARTLTTQWCPTLVTSALDTASRSICPAESGHPGGRQSVLARSPSLRKRLRDLLRRCEAGAGPGWSSVRHPLRCDLDAFQIT